MLGKEETIEQKLHVTNLFLCSLENEFSQNKNKYQEVEKEVLSTVEKVEGWLGDEYFMPPPSPYKKRWH